MTDQQDNILKNIDVKDKAYSLSGKSHWEIGRLEKYGFDTIVVSDGPHGLRRAINVSNHDKNKGSIEAVCFPTASAQACSFDDNLLFNLGQLLGIECQAEDVQVLLGPANNIKRTPLCGRNFEYYSEDPFLSGKLSAALIKGIQSKGIGTSLKHYLANNQEKYRFTINAVIDERTLREIYLTAFEIPVKESQPWTIMASYNRINGSYGCQNTYLLQDILRKEWQFEGLVMSDWGAVDQIADSIKAGMDVEMPSSGSIGPEKILTAVQEGKLPLTSVDEATRHVIALIEKAKRNRKPETTFSKEEHHQKARELGRECIVLLKNEDNILPLTTDKYSSIALLGDFAMHPRFQGGGSSHINTYKVDTLVDEFKQHGTGYTVTFAQGFDRNVDTIDQKLVQEALEVAKKSDVVIACIGLPDSYESEGRDRKHLDLPPNQISLVEEMAKVTSNIMVVLSIGSVVKLPFLSKIKGLLCNWLLGEAGAGSTFDVLTGLHNPSGKLAETFILSEQDDPSYGHYPGDYDDEYKEGVFVGYRFHDYYKKEVVFEFGYGLSYTTFDYSNLTLSKETMKDNEEVTVSVTIKNTGSMAGKEVVQVYVSEVKPILERPPLELKGFKKVSLGSGESKTIEFTLNKRSFAYYNATMKDWHVKSGEFLIQIGKSSRTIVLEKKIHMRSTTDESALKKPEKVYVKRLFPNDPKIFTRNTKMEDLKNHPSAKAFYQEKEQKFRERFSSHSLSEEYSALDYAAIGELFDNMPLRGFINSNKENKLSEEDLHQLLVLWNKS